MSKKEPRTVPASEKPWMNHDDPFVKTFYPLSWGKKNSYTIFSPGINRFLLVDSYDPWIVHETSRVISSKISNIVYVLDQVTPPFDNSNCLEYSTIHKINEMKYGGPTAMAHRQSSFMMKIQKDNVAHYGWPQDFIKPDRKEALLRLQEYIAFSLRAVYAITIGLAFRDPFPEKYYMETYFRGEYPEDFVIRSDITSAPFGIDVEIKKILYNSQTLEEALDNIHKAWIQYSQDELVGIRQAFYWILGLEQPPEVKALGNPTRDSVNYTLWAV